MLHSPQANNIQVETIGQYLAQSTQAVIPSIDDYRTLSPTLLFMTVSIFPSKMRLPISFAAHQPAIHPFR